MIYSFLVHHLLEMSATRLPNKTAVICGDERVTYQQIEFASARIAAALIDMEVEKGDRVAIFADNSIEAVVSLFAVLKAGAIFILPNPAMKPKKLSRVLLDSGCRVLITHQRKARVVDEALLDVPCVAHRVWVGTAPPTDTHPSTQDHRWDELLSRACPRLKQPPIIDVDVAAIIYTSGVTGEPKGIMCNHRAMLSAARSVVEYLENVEGDVILNALPLSFSYGVYQVLMAFMVGATIVLETSFLYPFKTLERVAAERATGFPLVPAMAAMLIRLEGLTALDLRSVRYVTSSAAPLPIAHIRRLRTLFPRAAIYSMFGLTECKRVSYLPPDKLEQKPDSVGIPMPNVAVMIVDDAGREVERGEIGEMVVRGSNVMQGYWNAPEQTARTFRRVDPSDDIRLFTGDLFRRDEEGYLYFVARRDDLIKTRGGKVSPREIEEVLYGIEGVAEAAVIAVPDDVLGQAIKAFIVKEIGLELTREKVLRHCTTNLEPFMIPKHVEFRESFPRTSSGKIDKTLLRE